MAADIAEQYDKIYRYCYLRVHNRPLAEDLAQETFLRYFGQADIEERLSAGRQLAYLYTIAGNLCIDHFRKSGREEPVFDEESWNELPDKKNEIGVLPEKIAVRQAVAQLPPKLQEFILLRFAEELTIAEIAQIFEISRFAAYRMEGRALKLLKEKLI